MQVMELKATLYRANPSVIRQFTVPCGATAKQLGKILSMVIGWKESEKWRMWNRERDFPDTIPLEKIFEAGDTFYWGPRIKEEKRDSKAEERWVFRVTLLGRAEQPEEYPKVVRFRGMNPPRSMKGVCEFNRLQRYWNTGDFKYYEQSFRRCEYGDFEFFRSEVNRILRRTFGPLSERENTAVCARLNYKNAYDIKDMIGGLTLQDLKEIGKNAEIHLPANVKKAFLIDLLTEKLNDVKLLDRAFQSLSLGQYRAFQSICTGQDDQLNFHTFIRVYHAVSQYGYWCLSGFYDEGDYDELHKYVVCSRTLLRTYEDWLDEGMEKSFLKRAGLITSIYGCVRFYGFIEKSEWKELADRWMPGMQTNEELEREWTSLFTQLENMDDDLIGRFRRDVLYDREVMDEKGVKTFLAVRERMPRYLPSFDELKKVEERGLSYEGQAKKELETFLEKRCGLPSNYILSVNSELYRLFQSGAPVEECVKRIYDSLRIHNKHLIQEMSRLFGKLDLITRKIGYGGHTKLEWESLHR